MVNFNINIEKRHVWLLVLLVVAVGYVVAQGIPNPGHDVSEVGGLDAKIDTKISTALQQVSKSVSVSECEVVTSQAETATSGGFDIYAECSSDKVLMGGGCTPSTSYGIRVNRPDIGPNGPRWHCLMTPSGSAAHALCCKLSS